MRNSIYGARTRVSMESLLDSARSPVVTEGDAPVVEETAIDVALRPDPAAIVAETAVLDAADEVAERETDVVELTEAADNLEQVRGILEESLEENGLDRTGAAVVALNMQRSLSRIGTDINVPSMESYSSASNRIHATRLTMEAIEGKLKEIWEAIKAALMRVWEATKKFFASIFDSVTRVRTQAEKVKAGAAEATGTPTVQTVTAKGAGNKLATSGKISNDWFTTVTSALRGCAQGIETVKAVTDMYSLLAGDITQGKANEADIAKVITDYLGNVVTVANVFKATGGRAVPSANIPGIDNSKSDVVLSAVMPGNAIFYVASAKTSGSLADVVANSKAGFYRLGDSTGVSDEFPVMPGDAISSLADVVIEACNAIDQRKEVLEKMADAGKQLVTAGESLTNGKSDEEVAAIRPVLQALPRVQEQVGSWPKQVTGYLMSVSSAALSVATASLAAYRAADAGAAQLPAPTTAA